MISWVLGNAYIPSTGKLNPHATKRAWWEKRGVEHYYDLILSLTSFLPEDSKLSERIYCVRNGITGRVLCNHCHTNPVKFDVRISSYNKTCSNRCGALNADAKEKVRKTNLERYGVEYTSQAEIMKQRSAQTIRDRYGCDHVMQSEDIKGRVTRTMKERHGVDWAQQSKEIQQKSQITSKSRNGGKWHTASHITKDVLKSLDDPDWCRKQYQSKSLKMIADDLGICDGTIGNYFRKHGISIRKTHRISVFEKTVERFVRSIYDGPIYTSDRSIIGPKELDIVLPDEKLAIECCGIFYHSEKFKDKNYHLNKLHEANAAGYRLITLFSDEWTADARVRKATKDKLRSLVGNVGKRTYARKTQVVRVGIKERADFFSRNHIQGDGNASITYGLTENGQLVACMGLKRRSDGVFELTRYATSHSVVGGFSKLLRAFQRDNEWNEIVSFADRRWSEGDVYERCGFELDVILSPDYRYVVGHDRVHKFQFRHRYLKNKLESYDPNKTEHDNCLAHGYYRVYDCGLLKYRLSKAS